LKNLTSASRWAVILVILAGAIAFLPMLGRKDIVTSHEARVAQTARQMAASGWPWNAQTLEIHAVGITYPNGMLRLAPIPGEPPVRVNPWLVPVMNRRIRLQKTPLPYWAAAVMFRWFGVHEWTARFVPALLGLLCAPLMIGLGRELYGKRLGVLAGLIWVSSYFIVDEFRKAMADPYLAFATLLCVWAWIRAARSSPRSRNLLIVLFWAGLGIGVLAKGPVILLHVAIAMGAYAVCARPRWRWPKSWPAHVAGAVLFLLISLPWPLYVLSHVPGALTLWRYESVGEFGENVEKARQWWSYLPGLLLITIPWTPLAILGIARGIGSVVKHRQWHFSATASVSPKLFPLIWVVITVFIFSLLNVKKNAYLLPMTPALVLLSTDGLITLFAHLRRGGRRARLSHDVRFVTTIAVILAIVLALVLIGPVASHENERSPREVCADLTSRLKANPSIAMCDVEMPEEISFYLPLNVNISPTARKTFVALDKTLATPELLATRFPDRTILSTERITSPKIPENSRWKVYEVTTK
jgi:4-amino-4-deoxy-L-arabinose transferase-like glycosyltransferase